MHNYEQPFILNGIRIVSDIHMTMPGEPYEVTRTLKERLLTLPWRPHVRTRTVIDTVPSNQMIRFNDSIVMHPAVAHKLIEQCKENK